MAEIKDSKLIRDALGSPVPQYWDETSQMYIARTVDGSFSDVDFGKVRMIRDKLGSPIPQLWDTETARFVPGKGGANGDVTIESVPGLKEKLDTTTAQLADTGKITGVGIAKYKHLRNGNDWTAALQAAFDEVKDTGGTVVLSYGETYGISSTTLRSANPVLLMGYGATIVPLLPDVPAITSYGNSNKFIGFKISIATVPAVSDTFIGIKVTNDSVTKSSNYNSFQDIEMYNIHRGIWFFMDGTVGGACYRHQLHNVVLRNMSLKGWAGSFGVSFDGTTNGDSSGNDSKLIGCYLKGYENNLKVINSIGTKLLFTSIDSGSNGIYYDGGAHLTVIGSYMEYNTVVFKVVNSPHKLNIILGTIASNTDTIDGTLLNNENPKFLSSEGPEHDLIESLGYFLEVLATGITRVQALNGVRLGEMKTGQYVDFKQISSGNSGFDASAMTDHLLLNLAAGKEFRIGSTSLYTSVTGDGGISTSGRISGTLNARNRATNPSTLYSNTGDLFFDTALNVFKARHTSLWRTLQSVTSGSTGSRPPGVDVGFQYFDTTLGKPVWCKTATVYGTGGVVTTPAVWVDATGTTA